MQSLSSCPLHDRPYELLCTSLTCAKPRLGCTKCFHDKSHKECKPYTVLIEDLYTQQYTDNLESWLSEETYRKELSRISDQFPYDLEAYTEEIALMISEKFKKMKENINKRLENLENEVQEAIREKILKNQTINLYKTHFSLKTLVNLISKSQKLENKDLQGFFSYKIDDFLEKYKNEKELIYFSKKTYAEFLNKRGKLFDNLNLSLQEDILSLDYFNMLFIKPKDIMAVKRFNKYGNSWGYVKDKFDCVSFKCNRTILLQGMGIMTPLKINDAIRINYKVIEGESNEGRVLSEGEYELVQKKGDFIEKREFIEPIIVKNGKFYSICLRIEGDDSYNGIEGEEIVKGEGDVMFSFNDTVVVGNNQDNNTNVSHGQLPELYYSVVS